MIMTRHSLRTWSCSLLSVCPPPGVAVSEGVLAESALLFSLILRQVMRMNFRENNQGDLSV